MRACTIHNIVCNIKAAAAATAATAVVAKKIKCMSSGLWIGTKKNTQRARERIMDNASVNVNVNVSMCINDKWCME